MWGGIGGICRAFSLEKGSRRRVQRTEERKIYVKVMLVTPVHLTDLTDDPTGLHMHTLGVKLGVGVRLLGNSIRP